MLLSEGDKSFFCRGLSDNNHPLYIIGKAFTELNFLMSYGEILGSSKVEFKEGQQIIFVLGLLKGHEWEILYVNKKERDYSSIISY